MVEGSLGCQRPSWAIVTGQAKTAVWDTEHLFSCNFTKTNMAAWNGCLAAVYSLEYASFPKLCENQTTAGFSWHELWANSNACRTYVLAILSLCKAKLYKPCHQQATWERPQLVLRDTSSPMMGTSCPCSFGVGELHHLSLQFSVCGPLCVIWSVSLFCSLSTSVSPLREKKTPKFNVLPQFLLIYQVLGQIWQWILLK
jgi:hypothetical protein